MFIHFHYMVIYFHNSIFPFTNIPDSSVRVTRRVGFNDQNKIQKGLKKSIKNTAIHLNLTKVQGFNNANLNELTFKFLMVRIHQVPQKGSFHEFNHHFVLYIFYLVLH